MGKNKNKNKTPGKNGQKTIQHIPSVGLQTAHFKSKQKQNTYHTLANRPRRSNYDQTRQRMMQEMHGMDAHSSWSVNAQTAPPAPVVAASAASAAGPVMSLPAGMHVKLCGFTANNYSTCRPTGLPQLPGVCPLCHEYVFDITPHLWTFHELDLAHAQRLATTGSL